MTSPLRLGIAGLGTVGAATVQGLRSGADAIARRAGRPIEVVAVSARDKTRERGIDLSGITWIDDPVQLAGAADIDVFVELIGGETGAAHDSVQAAIAAGRSVVTANKALLAHHGTALAKLAESHGAAIRYEAAVAGGIPAIKALREAVAGNRVSRVFGILNGTCNYILTRMEREGLDFATCLAEAQRLGYAEADPTFDIGGFDAAHKLALLSALAFGTEIDLEGTHVEGISSISPEDLSAADELGYRVKLLGVARRTQTGIEQRVSLTMVPKASAMAGVDGVLNAVAIDGDLVGELMLVGPGAGGGATASAVIADLIDHARGADAAMLGVPASDLAPPKRAQISDHVGPYYVRLSVYDRPGAFAAIATRMAEAGISLESIVQKGPNAGGGDTDDATDADLRPVVLITHDTSEDHIRSALRGIEADGHIADAPHLIRIEPAANA